MAKVAALLGRDNLPKRHLHLFGLLDAIDQAHPVDQADAVGIGYNRWLAEHVPHHEVGALAPDARQLEQFLKGLWNATAILIAQYLHAGADIARLAGAQPARMHDLLNIIHIRRGQRLDVRIFFIQLFHHYIDARICTLGRKAQADQELPRLIVIERTARVGVLALEPVNDFQRTLLFCHRQFLPFHRLLIAINRIGSFSFHPLYHNPRPNSTGIFLTGYILAPDIRPLP